MNDFKELCGLSKLWPERREQVLRYLNPEDKARCLAAGLMMSFVLGITDASRIRYNLYGKPFLSDSSVYFNLSHSGDYIVLAVDEKEVGIDIEKIETYSDGIAKKCFVPEEYSLLKHRKEDNLFYALWTAKESVMKACGKGLQMPPESFSVLPVEDGPHLIDGKIWFLSRLIHDSHQICVASEKQISEMNIIYLSKSELLGLSGGNGMNALEIEAKAENLDQVISFIDDALSVRGFEPQTVSKTKIAGEEIFINICSYAYAPETGTVQLRSRPFEDAIQIEFQDSGRPFNPLSADRIGKSAEISELTEGGYGILMVRNLVSEISYRFADGKNILTIIIKKE